jgi:general secretion pathway protein E
LVTRVKILAMLDISERRLPQDGNISLTVGSRIVDLRVSTMLTIHGESVVLRILDHSREIETFEGLGIDDRHARRLRDLVGTPNGIVLITGPTGSGKTTTLYACLRLMDGETRNIVTLEDPVEYRLPGIRQSQIHEKAGITFDAGLRAILRQDPDVILVGEMRDQQTVQTALRAALTGHLVLSTLHTNSALGAVTRLREMGVEPYLLASSLIAVGAQRLARRICPECRGMGEATEVERIFLGKEDCGRLEVPRANGCPACHETGYRGRFAVLELLVPDIHLRDAIAAGKNEAEILVMARVHGFETLREAMSRRVLDGWSTVEEMVRVIV